MRLLFLGPVSESQIGIRFEASANGEPIRWRIISGYGAGVGGRRRNCSPEHTPQHPVTALHRARTQAGRVLGKEHGHGEDTASAVAGGVAHAHPLTRRTVGLRHAVVTGQHGIHEGVFAVEDVEGERASLVELHARYGCPVVGVTKSIQGATVYYDVANLNAVMANPAYGTRWRIIRENIYNGWGPGWSTSGGAHVGFMTSTPHRTTLLMPQLTAVGIGVTCSNGHLWVAEEFALSIAYPMPPAPPVPPQDPIAAPAMTGPSC